MMSGYDSLNKKRFSKRRKVDSERAATTSVGSVFQACGAATAKARLPGSARQNESLFRSNGTRVSVLLGFRSDGFSFYWAVARLPTGDSLTGGTARRLALVERGVRRPGKASTRVSGPRYTQRTVVEYEASRYQWQALSFQSLRDESVPVCVGRRGGGFCIAATAAEESTQSVIESSRRRRRR